MGSQKGRNTSNLVVRSLASYFDKCLGLMDQRTHDTTNEFLGLIRFIYNFESPKINAKNWI